MREMEDFIFVLDDAADLQICADIISSMDEHIKNFRCSGDYLPQSHRCPSSLRREDFQIYCPEELQYLYSVIGDIAFDALAAYKNNFNSLEPLLLYISTFKLQKTPVGGGFHNWHTEREGGGSSQNRELAWMLYLNDVEEGGETEFLYQSKRVIPKAGRIVIWPAGFTHPHRGNPPLSGDKYIATGWFKTAHDPCTQGLMEMHKAGNVNAR